MHVVQFTEIDLRLLKKAIRFNLDLLKLKKVEFQAYIPYFREKFPPKICTAD